MLRREGQYIVQKLTDFFSFTDLDEETAHQAITRWLQNVLNLPVYLETESTRVFCAELETTVSDLIAAADALDINVAIVDELIQRWHEAKVEADNLAAQILSTDPNVTAAISSG